MRTVLMASVAALVLAPALAQQPPAGPGLGEGPTPPWVQPPLVGSDSATSAKTFIGNEAAPDQEQPPNYSEPFESPDTKENVILPQPPIYQSEPNALVNNWRGGAIPQRLNLEIEDWIGKPVHLVDVEGFGTLEDLVIDPESGNVTGLVLETGGVLGLGGERVVIPWVGITRGEDEQSLHAPWTLAEVRARRFNLQPGSPALQAQAGEPVPPEPGTAGGELPRDAFLANAARTGIFEAWDRDDDGRIDAAERAAGLFRQMDRDRDARLSAAEVRTGWGRWFGPEFQVDLAHWDLTSDALLDREEWTAGVLEAGAVGPWDAPGALTEDEFYAGLFGAIDADASGTLSLYERQAVAPEAGPELPLSGEQAWWADPAILNDDQGIWWDEDQWASWY